MGRVPPAMLSFRFSVSYKLCRTPLPPKDFLPQGNPSETTLDGVKAPLHCQKHCQVTRWHWRTRPPNISEKAHLLLPFNSLFGCWHGEDFVFPELDVCQHPQCSPTHPHPPPALSKLLSLQMCCVFSHGAPIAEGFVIQAGLRVCVAFFPPPFL